MNNPLNTLLTRKHAQPEIVIVAKFFDNDFTWDTDDQLNDRLDEIDHMIVICKATKNHNQVEELHKIRTSVLSEIQYRIQSYTMWGGVS
jgi:hypothetical protein